MTDEEFRAFVAARASALRRTGYLLTGDWQLGEDLAQSALVATWRRLDRLREPSAVEAYVRTTMARTYLSWRRVRRFAEIPTAATGDVDPGPDPNDDLLERDLVWAALQRLPANQRAALVLRYYEDLTVAAIADMLGSQVGTVKSHLSRGLATLRRNLEPAAAKETP
jgi:RNA polymerase sigma-70 factor (sigma-E family)